MKEINICIAQNISRLRKEHNKTQMQLADAIGVSNKTISKWEKSESEPELVYVAAIAEYYGVSMDSLVCGNSENAVGQKNSDALSYHDAALQCFYNGVEETFKFTENISHLLTDNEHQPCLPRTGLSYKGDMGNYTGVQTPEIFIHARSTSENNMLIMLMQNENNFAWLEQESERFRDIFTLFAEPGILQLIRFLHTDGTPVRMTAEYASEMTGCDVKNIRKLFELMGSRQNIIEFNEGSKIVYTVCGNGYLLTALASVYEAFLGSQSGGTRTIKYDYKPIFYSNEKE